MSHLLLSLQAAMLLLAFLSLSPFSATTTSRADTCAGVGLAPPGGDGKKWISCAGACDVGNCKIGSGTDAQGDFQFCGCGSPPIEPSCCHLVARKKPNEDPVLDVRGLCTNISPDCADADGLVCRLWEQQPVCLPPGQ
jgi:hypothetical protein